MPVWLRLLFRFALTLLLVWALSTYLDQYFFVTGGWKAYVIIASLITLMNLIVRPVLDMIVLPLKLLATILALVLVNAVFLWLTVWIVNHMERDLVTLDIQGGVGGWIVVILALGISKWLMKVSLK